jgi:hypothetical protein
MNEDSLMLKCPSCGEAIELQIRKAMKKPASIEDVKDALKELIEQVNLTESDDSILVTPKGYLGKDLWYQINDALKPFDTQWVSAGKQSKWVIKS